MNVLVFADSHDGMIAKSAFEAVTYGSKIAKDWLSRCSYLWNDQQ
jgi:hypothetical protein